MGPCISSRPIGNLRQLGLRPIGRGDACADRLLGRRRRLIQHVVAFVA
jgi:hypothetical protein